MTYEASMLEDLIDAATTGEADWLAFIDIVRKPDVTPSERAFAVNLIPAITVAWREVAQRARDCEAAQREGHYWQRRRRLPRDTVRAFQEAGRSSDLPPAA